MSTPSPSPNPAQQIMQLSTGYMPAVALYIVAKLGIADRLKDGPKRASELATATSTNPDALYRLLRALASLGIFTETAPGEFGLTPVASTLRSDVPDSMRAMAIWMGDPFHLRIYADLYYSIQTGKPALEHLYGKSAFEYLGSDPEESEVFHAAMTSFSGSTVPAILEAYDFSSINTLVDIGGGHGFMLTAILKKYPQMKGKLFEMESVCAGARSAIEKQGLGARCEIQHGDFFAGVPAGADAYIMKHIIHDWDDAKATVLLKNVRTALGDKPKGKLLVVDAVVAPGNEPHFAKFLDLEMMVICGSRERTAEEFRNLFARAGFRMTRIISTKSPVCVIEGEPA